MYNEMRKFINKILNVPKLILRLWIILWVCLVILLVLKFCFGMWYPIVIENGWFLKLNDYLRYPIPKYIALSLFYFASVNIIYLTCRIKKKYDNIKECIIVNVLILVTFIIKANFSNLGFIPEIFISVILPIIFNFIEHGRRNKFRKIIFPIIIEIIVSVWQLNILLVRGIDFAIDSEEYILIGIVLQLDYYIFIIITWLEVSFMGLFSLWFFGKDVTSLKAEKEKELAKEQPDMKKVAKIDERIKELESENK